MTSKVLVLGANGQLGRSLCHANWPGAVELVALDRTGADLSRRGDAAAAIARHAPDLVVNAAAHTAVDRAETEHDLAFAVNAAGPGEIAQAAAVRRIPVVHVSTDYVFDGTKTSPYVETDAIAPLGVYGRSKAEGEAAVRAAAPQHVILRTSWVYSAGGQNFVRTMLRLGAERDELKVVDDQTGAPTSADDLASAIARIAPRLLAGDDSWGTYHLTGGGETSWHGFADVIFQDMARRTGRRPRLSAIPTSAYPTPARRPANSRLDNEKFARVFGFRMPDWQDALPGILDRLHAGAA